MTSQYEYASASSGRSDFPFPRGSNTTTRKWRDRYGICPFHIRECEIGEVGKSRNVVGASP